MKHLPSARRRLLLFALPGVLLTGCATWSGSPPEQAQKTVAQTRAEFDRCVREMRAASSARQVLSIEARYNEAGIELAEALDRFRAYEAQADKVDEATSRAIETNVAAITATGIWLQAQRALFEDVSHSGWSGAVCPKAGGPAAALQGIMARTLNDGDMAALFDGIDWITAFSVTPPRLLEGYRIASPQELRELCQLFAHKPEEALLRPLQPMLDAVAANTAAVERVRAAYAELGGAVKPDVDEGLAGWQKANYVFGAERSNGQRALVPLLTVEDGEDALLLVQMVRADDRWLLAGEWVPGVLQGYLESAFSRPEAKAARDAINALGVNRPEEVRPLP